MLDNNTSEIIRDVQRMNENLRSGLQDEDQGSVLSTAADLLARIELLDISHPGLASATLPAEGTSAAWLIKTSVTELLRASSLMVPDWESARVSSSFTDEAVRQLSTSLEST